MKSVKSKVSDQSDLMHQYLEEQRKNRHEQELLEKIKIKQQEEIEEMNRKIAKKFKNEAEQQSDMPIEIQNAMNSKKSSVRRRTFNVIGSSTLMSL